MSSTSRFPSMSDESYAGTIAFYGHGFRSRRWNARHEFHERRISALGGAVIENVWVYSQTP